MCKEHSELEQRTFLIFMRMSLVNVIIFYTLTTILWSSIAFSFSLKDELVVLCLIFFLIGSCMLLLFFICCLCSMCPTKRPVPIAKEYSIPEYSVPEALPATPNSNYPIPNAVYAIV